MKIEINNKIVKPFFTLDTPTLFNLPSNSKVCLVGNSGLMLDKKWGTSIDDYDVVVRFNHAPTEGYEEYVGSKTTLRMVNGHCFGGLTDVKKNPTAKKDFLPLLPVQDIICKTWNTEEFMYGVFNNVNKHKLYFLHYELLQEIGRYTPGQEPSAGLVMLMLMLPFFKQISMYGFTFWEGNYPYHYFEEVPLHANQLGHNFSREKLSLIHI